MNSRDIKIVIDPNIPAVEVCVRVGPRTFAVRPQDSVIALKIAAAMPAVERAGLKLVGKFEGTITPTQLAQLKAMRDALTQLCQAVPEANEETVGRFVAAMIHGLSEDGVQPDVGPAPSVN